MPPEKINKSVHLSALQALMSDDVDNKLTRVEQLTVEWSAGQIHRDCSEQVKRISIPGRPNKPDLVPPRQLKNRKLKTSLGRAALVHSVCHIEFNAINLALDAVYRFRELPDQFYTDWLSVAADEARHFQMLRARLRQLDVDYGDFPAHNGLWEAACKTDHDPLVRMALVPRVLEARGLDVTPGMIERLTEAGDFETVAILEVILQEEIRHVAIGTHWFRYLCKQRSENADELFLELLGQYLAGPVRGPLHEVARQEAGFSEVEMQYLRGVGR